MYIVAPELVMPGVANELVLEGLPRAANTTSPLDTTYNHTHTSNTHTQQSHKMHVYLSIFV
jgi:hypothetical protein